MTRIHWTTPAGLINTALVANGEAAMHTTNGMYYAPVKVEITGRTLTRTCAGNLGTKARIAFEDATVSGWVS